MTRVEVMLRRGREGAPTSLSFDINGPGPGFQIGTERISGWSVAMVPPRLLDLLDVAAAILAVDGMVPRGGLTRPRFGACWQRGLVLRMGVRDVGFWSRDDVRNTLARTIGFLTGDVVAFDFGAYDEPAGMQDYLDFADQGAPALAAEHVVLFSGGLDSLAGALETLAQVNGRVVLVTHRSAQKILPHQDRLAKALQERHPGRVAHVPVRATMKGQKAAERTQRSRSFLFAALGHVISELTGSGQVDFFENGIVSQNLPVSPQIIGTMATRTTHAHALRLFEEFLALVRGEPVRVRNRFEWMTKTEVVTKIRDHGAADLIHDTVSCNHVYDRPRGQTHCGACTQCLDRRFGVLAAGLGDHDPEEIYETPVLLGTRDAIRSRTIAQEWTRHALALVVMPAETFGERFGGEIGRVARGYPDVAGGDILRRSLDMHRRHGAAVRRVLDQALQKHSGEILDRSLPASCLLRVAVAESAGDLAVADVESAAGVPAAIGSDDPWEGIPESDGSLHVLLIEADGARWVSVRGLGDVHGAPATPVFALHPYHAADLDHVDKPEAHGFVRCGDLIPEAGPSKSAVAQNIKRCRDQLADYHMAIFGSPPAVPLLIENRHNRGYRLDPGAEVLESGPIHPSGDPVR